jgi:hypothetical protein
MHNFTHSWAIFRRSERSFLLAILPQKGDFDPVNNFLWGLGVLIKAEIPFCNQNPKKRSEHEEQSYLPIIFYQGFGMGGGLGPVAFLQQRR